LQQPIVGWLVGVEKNSKRLPSADVCVQILGSHVQPIHLYFGTGLLIALNYARQREKADTHAHTAHLCLKPVGFIGTMFWGDIYHLIIIMDGVDFEIFTGIRSHFTLRKTHGGSEIVCRT
jgi:hypothetical protein